MNVFTDNTAFGRLLRFWTDFSQPVRGRQYLTHGLALATLKYLGDAILIHAASGTFWTPAEYLRGVPSLFARGLSGSDVWWLGPALLFWMLPFVWLGITLTMRRAVDANRSPWLAVLFLVPYVNYFLIVGLSWAASKRPANDAPRPVARTSVSDVAAAGISVATGVLIAVLLVGAGLKTLNAYGAWLFVLTPFVIGASTGFVYNRWLDTTSSKTSVLVIATVVAAGGALLVFGIEGLVCIVMALPIAIPLALLGGTLGRNAALSRSGPVSPIAFMLLALPMTAAFEPGTGSLMHEVRSSVIIGAPPNEVWPHVVAFREIPVPDDWLFRVGVAYPIRARIDGTGVGAMRYCVFSTGSFVEPITRWEVGRRLSFDVIESPATMTELSPYRNLSPRHLHGYLRSRRGEFRFVDLGDGRTRLEGSTWYEIEMAPEGYWQMFSDMLIHRIHQRVLDHIKREVETERRHGSE